MLELCDFFSPFVMGGREPIKKRLITRAGDNFYLYEKNVQTEPFERF